MKRKEQRERRRELIIKKSLDLFLAKGYENTTIKDIAKECDMSVGLLFEYYKSKYNLYESIVLLGLNSSMNIFDNEKDDIIEIFKNITTIILDLVERDTFEAKMFVFMNQARNSSFLPNDIKAKIKNEYIINKTMHMFIEGQKKGFIRQGDPYALAYTYWSVIQGITEEKYRNKSMPLPKYNWLLAIIFKESVL